MNSRANRWVCVQVIIGGGRKYMTPKGFPDPEYPADLSAQGQRKDNRNLINEWLSMKEGKVEHLEKYFLYI